MCLKEILRSVYNSKRLCVFLKIASHVSALIGVLAYAYILVLGYKSGLSVFLKLILFSAVPFFAVSLVRKLINSKRPYEKYDFYLEKPKEKKGQSFPSRHVFSAFIIATLMYMFSPILAWILCAFGIVLSVARVLLGIHFIEDVVFGALIGIFSGILAIFLI